MTTLKASLERFEGRVAFMYLDSRGNCTVGIGHLLRTPDAACALSFTHSNGAILATREQIIAEYINVKTLEPNHKPDYYRQRTKLRLSDAAVDRLLDTDITEKRSALESLVNLAVLPDPAQTALMDMIFNIGAGSLRRYPRLLAACDTRNWTVAANECHRDGIPKDRNDATAALFRGLASAHAAS